ncbi:MAG TPA: hypothetical protein VMR33_23730 [Candidatus Baltobacteraceae bacterium]|jgi:hypothetical protein|nr:hypothetical protein [Candidatus Baltobacteraceae bacterium]
MRASDYRVLRFLICTLVVASAEVGFSQGAFTDTNWVSLNDGSPGTDPGGSVSAIAVNSQTGLVYIGGGFNSAGTVLATNVAQWDGTNWSPLGPGLADGPVLALALDSAGNLYAGGAYANVYKWDGKSWTAVGSLGGGDGFGFGVSALVYSDPDIFVAGDFTLPGTYVAAWNGSYLSQVGSGIGLETYALAADGFGDVYIGGFFSSAGGSPANYVAEWDGDSWSALGSGLNYYVSALAATPNGSLYAAGDFTSAGGMAAEGFAQWNGTSWTGLDTMVQGGIKVLLADSESPNAVYVAGNSSPYGPSIAEWTEDVPPEFSSNWITLGTGINGDVLALAQDSAGNLYAGGQFTMAGNTTAYNIAKWNGASWSALSASGSSSSITDVRATVIDSAGNLYVGGSFAGLDGTPANNVAEWNGGAWMPVGSGVSGSIDALALDSAGNLYAGGTFTNAGGNAATNIAKWNGSAWSSLGLGVNSTVWALAVDRSNNLYAGGYFTNAGGVAANYIAKWNGNRWSGLGSGMNENGNVWALATDSSSNLYAGGYFTNAGGVPANYIAKWNGAGWSPLGSGFTSQGIVTVSALTVDKADNLYAGGLFESAGGVSANNIASWNGSNWIALGAGVTVGLEVESLVLDDVGNLYVGGNFDTAGNISANSIAKWDGIQWSALGSGATLGPPDFGTVDVYALATDHFGHLYAGGNFTVAGTTISPCIAQANILTLLSREFLYGNGNVSFQVVTTPHASSRVWAATNLMPPVLWQPIFTNVASDTGAWEFTDGAAQLYPARFYRVSTP